MYPKSRLYRIVPEYRAVLLDGGNVKRVMFVDLQDERLSTWKPGTNTTFCPDGEQDAQHHDQFCCDLALGNCHYMRHTFS